MIGAQVSTHWCGGELLFVREPDGRSWERCTGCGWSYDFDRTRSRPAEQVGPVVIRVGA